MARNYARNHVTSYYIIRNQLTKVYQYDRDGVPFVCEICFEPICHHNAGKDTTESAIEQLQWWADIALTEGRTLFIHEDYPAPIWMVGEYNSFREYRAVPKLDGEIVALFSRNKESKIVKMDGTVVETNHVAGDGYCYGYDLGDRFYGLATFNNGLWCEPEKHAADYQLLPPHTMLKGTYWYIPTASDHSEFLESLSWQSV